MTSRNLVSNRRFTLILSMALISVLLIAFGISCAGPYPSRPEKVVEGFWDAIAAKDYKRAESYCSKNYLTSDDYKQAKKQMANAPDPGDIPEGAEDFAKNMLKKMTENLQGSVEGDTAKVWPEKMSYMKYVLKKEGGKWKINNVEMDEAELMKSMGGMMEGMGDMMEGMDEETMKKMKEGME